MTYQSAQTRHGNGRYGQVEGDLARLSPNFFPAKCASNRDGVLPRSLAIENIMELVFLWLYLRSVDVAIGLTTNTSENYNEIQHCHTGAIFGVYISRMYLTLFYYY
ncbi:hypothetical protein DdX_11441 [Ditylenchus destructor]|uniref:Uncharacterized protein n=1 Tax=Ditylenchus destructor TaxID=166010 RepID=A0AAD4N2G8_9BILA|nr:hypothetical protein DdX_11441 [Ditylenchus destructor]